MSTLSTLDSLNNFVVEKEGGQKEKKTENLMSTLEEINPHNLLTYEDFINNIGNDPISIDSYEIDLSTNFSFNKEKFDNYIKKAKKKGDIFETKPGFVKTI